MCQHIVCLILSNNLSLNSQTTYNFFKVSFLCEVGEKKKKKYGLKKNTVKCVMKLV